MDEIKKPSVGRIVHYYHEGGIIHTNGAEFLPAIVLQTFGGLVANLTVFIPGQVGPCTVWSAHHESEKLGGSGYWVWPEVK
jgi:hypothetical protein